MPTISLIEQCLLLSGRIYSPENLTKDQGLGLGLSLFCDPIIDDNTNTALIIAVCNTEFTPTIFIACKGTQFESLNELNKENYLSHLANIASGNGKSAKIEGGIKDLMTDFSVSLHKDEEKLGSGILVHYGFFFAASQVSDAVCAQLNHFGNFNGKVVLCGHSLGGAVVSVLILFLEQFFNTTLTSCNVEFHLVTFGCPHVGNKAFAEQLTSTATSITRYAHRLDLIPNLLSVIPEYVHPVEAAPLKDSLTREILTLAGLTLTALDGREFFSSIPKISYKYLIQAHGLENYNVAILQNANLLRLGCAVGVRGCLSYIQNNAANSVSIGSQSAGKVVFTETIRSVHGFVESATPIGLLSAGASVVSAGASIYTAYKVNKFGKLLDKMNADIAQVQSEISAGMAEQRSFNQANQEQLQIIKQTLDEGLVGSTMFNEKHFLNLQGALRAIELDQSNYHSQTLRTVQDCHNDLVDLLDRISQTQSKDRVVQDSNFSELRESIRSKIDDVRSDLVHLANQQYRLTLQKDYELQFNKLNDFLTVPDFEKIQIVVRESIVTLETIIESWYDGYAEAHLHHCENSSRVLLQLFDLFLKRAKIICEKSLGTEKDELEMENQALSMGFNYLRRLHRLIGNIIFARLIFHNWPVSKVPITLKNLSQQLSDLINFSTSNLGWALVKYISQPSVADKFQPIEGFLFSLALNPCNVRSQLTKLEKYAYKFVGRSTSCDLSNLDPLNRSEIIDHLFSIVRSSNEINTGELCRILKMAVELEDVNLIVESALSLVNSAEVSADISVFVTFSLYSVFWGLKKADMNSVMAIIEILRIQFSSSLRFNRLKAVFNSKTEDLVSVSDISVAVQIVFLALEKYHLKYFTERTEEIEEFFSAVISSKTILPDFLGLLERLSDANLLPLPKYQLTSLRLEIISQVQQELSIGTKNLFEKTETFEVKKIEISLSKQPLILSDFIGAFYYLRSLVLTLVKLTELPRSVSWLHGLAFLTLDDNFLDDLPEEMENLKNLKSVSMKKNKFTVLPNVLFRLPKLQYLLLNDNCISNCRANLKEMVELSLLNLSGNALNKESLIYLSQFSGKVQMT